MAGEGLSIFRAFKDPSIADFGDAINEDPTLLQPKQLGFKDQLARSLNDVQSFMGSVFKNPELVQQANLQSRKFEEDDQNEMMARLMPALGRAQAKRENAATRALAEKQAADRHLRAASMFERLLPHAGNMVEPGEDGKDGPVKFDTLMKMSYDLGDGKYPSANIKVLSPDVIKQREWEREHGPEALKFARSKSAASEQGHLDSLLAPKNVTARADMVGQLAAAKIAPALDEYKQKLSAKKLSAPLAKFNEFKRAGSHPNPYGTGTLPPTKAATLAYIDEQRKQWVDAGRPQDEGSIEEQRALKSLRDTVAAQPDESDYANMPMFKGLLAAPHADPNE